MNRVFLCFLFSALTLCSRAQTLAFVPDETPKPTSVMKGDDGFYRAKPISYNCYGYLAPMNINDLVIGGTSVVTKRFGSFLAYKMGIKNFSLPKGDRGDMLKKNVVENGGSFTGNYQSAVTFMLSTGITFAIWKKMPMYVGIGGTRYKYFFEYLDPFDNQKPKWNVDLDKTGFQLNYTAGFIIPLFSRILLNAGYDHNPKSVFIGIGIRAKDAYKDIDEWR